VQQSRPTLRLLSGPAACMSRQLVCLHGAGNRSPTRRGRDVCSLGSRRVSWPTPQSESRETRAGRRLVVRGGDLSGEVPLVGNWSEMLPTGWEHCVLPVRVLTRVLSPPRLEFGLDIVHLGLHVVNDVGLPCVKIDLLAVKGGPNPDPRQWFS
jgi:hypothetical protein